MKIWLECEFEVDHHERDNGTVRLDGLRFPGCNQNILPFLSVTEQDQAQQLVEDEVEKALQAKHDAIRERKEMRGDYRRDLAKDEAWV